MSAFIAKDERGAFHVMPMFIGLADVPFADAEIARRVKDAVNAAHKHGRDEMRSELRVLIGAAGVVEVDRD